MLKRYESYGWHTLTVADVNDLASLREAIQAAKAVTDRPTIIKVRYSVRCCCCCWLGLFG